MALRHLVGKNENFTVCGRRRESMGFGRRRISLFATLEQSFIEDYNVYRGKDFCSKCAKVLIEQGKIVAAENTITAGEKELIEKLTIAMKDLHDAYIVATKKYAKNIFEYLSKVDEYGCLDWCKHFGITSELANSHIRPVPKYDPSYELKGSEFWSMPSGFYNTKEYKRMKNLQRQAGDAIRKGFRMFEADEVGAAERHFSDSIRKLADRIQEKSLNVKKMSISNSSSVRGNGIDTTITDGVNVVNAWTIIAEGPVNRPHYRYLVK